MIKCTDVWGKLGCSWFVNISFFLNCYKPIKWINGKWMSFCLKNMIYSSLCPLFFFWTKRVKIVTKFNLNLLFFFFAFLFAWKLKEYVSQWMAVTSLERSFRDNNLDVKSALLFCGHRRWRSGMKLPGVQCVVPVHLSWRTLRCTFRSVAEVHRLS